MVFNSLTFLIFLAVTLLVYYRLPIRPQNLFLLAASYVFYGWWDWRFLFLLIFTSVFDYFCALAIERQRDQRRKRFWLAFSITLNMGVLCAFKYFNFFADSFAGLMEMLGMKVTLPVLHVILPLGISFYTFLSMSYTIDVYRGEMKATRDPVAFLLFVAFFPHLVAGPIVRASFLVPQCQSVRVIKYDQVATGIWLILLGYLKKVVIADRMASIVDLGFSGASASGATHFSDANDWLFLYAFAFQIYGDFSGYSDIARGLSKIMGFELPVNFRAPYLVTNPAAFWHHWHITLSTWLRDYLYIPLGGNRKGRARTYANLMVTMVLGGLWHGAGVAFLLWGAFQGLLLAVHRAFTHSRGVVERGRWRRVASRALLTILFFHITCVGWLLFRAGALPSDQQFPVIKGFLQSMFDFELSHGLSPLFRPVLLLGVLALVLQWKCEAMDRFHTWRLHWQAGAVAAVLTAIAGMGVFKGAQFIYFQF
jgi:D-alanyl-lipoteichoic acid acyltransferase DltB (MBOAT superfamily)